MSRGNSFISVATLPFDADVVDGAPVDDDGRLVGGAAAFDRGGTGGSERSLSATGRLALAVSLVLMFRARASTDAGAARAGAGAGAGLLLVAAISRVPVVVDGACRSTIPGASALPLPPLVLVTGGGADVETVEVASCPDTTPVREIISFSSEVASGFEDAGAPAPWTP